jgi:WD repeat and SOF domain-containing protein 1
MQRVFCVTYSGDSQFVFSGSDDTNIRIWKSNASAPTHVLLKREKQKINYLNKVKEKYENLNEVRKIIRYRLHY